MTWGIELTPQQKNSIRQLYYSMEQMLQRGLVHQDANGRITVPRSYFSHLSYAGRKGVNENLFINKKIYIPYNSTQLQHPAPPTGGEEYILIDGKVLNKLAYEHTDQEKLKDMGRQAWSKAWNQMNAPGPTGGITLTPSARGY